jgi:hypothetical protein
MKLLYFVCAIFFILPSVSNSQINRYPNRELEILFISESSETLLAVFKDTNEFMFVGHVDSLMLDFFQKLNNNEKIYLSSDGGRTDLAVEISKIIVKKNIKIEVSDICLSACADFIITSTKDLKLNEWSLIGFHNNDFIFRDERYKRGIKDRENCNKEYNEYTEMLYKKMGYKISSYKETYKRLDVYDYEMGSKCGEDKILVKNTMWLPTSKQLVDMFGFKLQNKICSDDYNCVLYRAAYFAKRKKIVIGDAIIDYKIWDKRPVE